MDDMQHQTKQVKRIELAERCLCNGGATITDLIDAIADAELAGGGGGDERPSVKTIQRLIVAVEQLGVTITRDGSRYYGKKSEAIFRGTMK